VIIACAAQEELDAERISFSTFGEIIEPCI
jgi:hypothetical protein